MKTTSSWASVSAAYRVVSSRDLRASRDRELDPRSGDLRHLREQGLVETVRVPGTREHAVVLTKEGRGLLENHRDRDRDDRQRFYDGLRRERELEHLVLHESLSPDEKYVQRLYMLTKEISDSYEGMCAVETFLTTFPFAHAGERLSLHTIPSGELSTNSTFFTRE